MATGTSTTPANASAAGSEPVAIDPRALRRVLGNFLTGVTVITCRRGEVVHGATVNAFTSVSMDPPLVLAALDRRSRAGEYLSEGGFVVNILADDQQDVAMHFAGRPMPGPVSWVDEDGDAPRLAGTIGHLHCLPWRDYDGGDHVLHVARVADFAVTGGTPLLFYRGDFPRLADGGGAAAWAQSLDGHGPFWPA